MSLKPTSYVIRITAMMSVVSAIFFICWLPWWIMFMVFPFQPAAADWFEGHDSLVTPYNILTWLGTTSDTSSITLYQQHISAYSNSCVNPCLYVVMDKDVREGICLLFRKLTKSSLKKRVSILSPTRNTN